MFSLHLIFSVSVNENPFPPYLTFSSPPPLCSLSVGSGWRLWDADSGTLGSLHGPAQCITTPLSPDALSYSNIRHQSLCAVSPPWFACYLLLLTLAITPHTRLTITLAWIHFTDCLCKAVAASKHVIPAHFSSALVCKWWSRVHNSVSVGDPERQISQFSSFF